MALPSDPLEVLSRALAGDRRALARAMSVVEDARPGADAVLKEAYPGGGRARIVGLTGSPGAGKSTLTDRLIGLHRERGARVGVVAVDPSSPFSGGAILGDRIRMQRHASDEAVFVRSMSSRGRLGGLADASAKVVALLDAAGYDPILLETVGVGQSEVEVVELADTVVVVVTPGMGDGVQAAKAGLLEVGDVFVVNKADRPGADEVVRDLTQMLEMGERRAWSPPILTTVAPTGVGVDRVAAAIGDHLTHLGEKGLTARRRRHAEVTVRRATLAILAERLSADRLDDALIDAVAARSVDPWTAARSVAG
jgi:LAO/AO transport system kinase